jgi:hypothetical protein
MKNVRGKLTYANVVSTLCLFLLVGGATAFAAVKLAKNSVGTKQLKKNSVTSAKIKNGAVTGAKIKLSSVGKVPSAARADSAGHADTAGDAGTLQGNPPSAFVHGNAQVFSVRRQLQIGDSAQLVAVPGIGTMTAKCTMGTTFPRVEFLFKNESGGTMDETLEYTTGTDAGTPPNGATIGAGAEAFAALRMKLATRTAPATIVVFDLNMAANVPGACPVFIQAIAST